MMEGQVRFILPKLGVSAIDKEGMPFYDPEADKALFDTIRSDFNETENRQLIEIDHHINDPEFSNVVVKSLNEIYK